MEKERATADPPMSEKKQKEIYADEFYREKARTDLANASYPLVISTWVTKPWCHLILRVVNSSFGIFLASTLIVGFVSWQYTTYQNEREQERRAANARGRISIELDHRIVQGLARFHEYENRIDQGMICLNGQAGDPKFAEFNGKSLESMGRDLIPLMASDEDRERIRQAIKRVSESGADSFVRELLRLHSSIAKLLPE